MGTGGGYLKTNRERRTRGSHDFKFIVPKGHKDIFRFSFFPRTITEWNKLPQETVSSQSLCIFKSKLNQNNFISILAFTVILHILV